VPSRAGNMSIRLSTRYTVVPLEAASLSMGVSGRTKCETSAISARQFELGSHMGARRYYLRTPTSMFPFGKRRACKASSIS